LVQHFACSSFNSHHHHQHHRHHHHYREQQHHHHQHHHHQQDHHHHHFDLNIAGTEQMLYFIYTTDNVKNTRQEIENGYN